MGKILLLPYVPGLIMFVYLLWRFLSMPKWPSLNVSFDELENGLREFRRWEKKANAVGVLAMFIAFILMAVVSFYLIFK